MPSDSFSKFGNTVKKFWLAELYQLFIEETLVPAKRESCVDSSFLCFNSFYVRRRDIMYVKYELNFIAFLTNNFDVKRDNLLMYVNLLKLTFAI